MITEAKGEPCLLTIVEAAERIRAGNLTAVELTRSVLARIEKLEPDIRAWARVQGDQALRDATRLDMLLRSGTWIGQLHGIPVGIKDVFWTAGIETCAGSPVLRGFVPERDSDAVRRVREAGAIILGKTETTEFAAYDPAPTRNPHDLRHTPGGSSSGSAAAVAAHMCLGALGTQTAGSILRPAAYCGVVGLKPTYGVVSREGIFPLAWSLDHAGPLAKTVADAALLFSAVAQHRPQSEAVPTHNCRVGVPNRYFTSADEETLAAYAEAVRTLGQLGAKVVEVTLPDSFEAAVAAGTIILRVEAAAFHARWFDSHKQQYGRKLRCLIEAGRRIPGPSYVRAQQIRRRAMEQISRLFEEVDVLATPATPSAAPCDLSTTGDAAFNTPFSVLGVPAITVPMPRQSGQMPLGLQLSGRYHAETTLFALALAYEQHAPRATAAARL
ncbi:MAG TPA: amidase [Bryobacteraceae bacterium]|nr:amidase [Bryobacteraceae bacterium]HWR37709.1 amidase [Clostridia bacterium]